jgi:hypothetical protein
MKKSLTEEGKSPKKKVSAKTEKPVKTTIEPSENDIREKALEIYLQRIDREEYGTSESDWFEALRVLADSSN